MVYHQLTLVERYLIEHELSMGTSLREIARKLGRSASTICRERRRNATTDEGRYRHERADSYARTRRRRSRQGTQYPVHEVELVRELMAQRWSPEQVSGRLKRQRKLEIATSTIYRWVKRDKASGGSLWQQTRRLSHRYRKGYRVQDHRGRLRGKTSIKDRPQVINERAEYGHWEGDTVMGKDGRHCVLTLVERKTLLLRIRKLPARKAEEVNRVMRQELGKKGKRRIRSLTLDNGTEFHGYEELQSEYDTKIYFATPYHSWERGTNENTNGLIRQYLPKGTCFKKLTQEHCQAIEDALNNRPRKKLGFRTPAEASAQECCA